MVHVLRRRWGAAGAALAAAGAVVLAAAVLAIRAAEPKPTVGADAAAALASPSPAGTAGTAGTAPAGNPAAGAGPAPGAVPVTAGTLPAPGPPAVRPVTLRAERIGLSAAVEPVGVGEDGQLAVPPDVAVVGWYRFGPGLDATAGSVVLAGHVDGAGQGPGAFFRLRELNPGDLLAVEGADGGTRRYRVVAREIVPKATVDLGRVFSRDGTPRLTLVTCGGPFDRGARSYRDNVVVTAAPQR